MRFISYAAFILFTIFCIIIAVSNGDIVNFSLAPLPINISMPAYMLVFIGILLGLLGGWMVSILSGIRHARRHRIANKKIQELEKQIRNK
ncbi:MAG: DUF1049 domain-containing protein [Kordiimonadaceae bacterium]|jgi:uncharacterized integral membrane protein|nr:DUF1049 domain-containing protein [Kordiimonadaceae bacterium]MBT6031631.1 DUF1049 domain-containing protein [Kordiimonadaceae bacterium]